MAIQRMDHVSIVVDDLEASIAFFVELGMEVEGTAPLEGPWVDAVNAIDGVRVDIAMMRTPDGNGRLELTKFHAPDRDPRRSRRTRRPTHSASAASCSRSTTSTPRWRACERTAATLQGEVAQYGDVYRLCYVRGPEGIIVALAEQLD